jgi:hypothetical protein
MQDKSIPNTAAVETTIAEVTAHLLKLVPDLEAEQARTLATEQVELDVEHGADLEHSKMARSRIVHIGNTMVEERRINMHREVITPIYWRARLDLASVGLEMEILQSYHKLEGRRQEPPAEQERRVAKLEKFEEFLDSDPMLRATWDQFLGLDL